MFPTSLLSAITSAPEPVYFFWGLVAFLALAAALNHSWHHARDSHLTSRLARVSYRDGRSTIVVVDADLEAFELD
jgi:hypothetical protein